MYLNLVPVQNTVKTYLYSTFVNCPNRCLPYLWIGDNCCYFVAQACCLGLNFILIKHRFCDDVTFLKSRDAEPELEPELEPEPAFFGSSGAGARAVNLPWLWLRSRLRTKLKNNFLNGRKYLKVSKKYAESADM